MGCRTCGRGRAKQSDSRASLDQDSTPKKIKHSTGISVNDRSLVPNLEVSEESARHRRKKCQFCPQSTKLKITKFGSTNGLNEQSICKENSQRIVEITASKNGECPLNLWK